MDNKAINRFTIMMESAVISGDKVGVCVKNGTANNMTYTKIESFVRENNIIELRYGDSFCTFLIDNIVYSPDDNKYIFGEDSFVYFN